MSRIFYGEGKTQRALKFSGIIFVISAPSGGGKTTLCKKVVKSIPDLIYSISFTTRPPRPGEKGGKDYFFISEKEFARKVKEKKLAEWAVVHGYHYGTPKDFLEDFLRKGYKVILNIDVQGGIKIKRRYPLNTVLVFVIPPSITVLKKRLTARKKDTKSAIKIRLENAKKELREVKKYDYLVINDYLEKAIKRLKSVIITEQMRIKRGFLKDTLSKFLRNYKIYKKEVKSD